MSDPNQEDQGNELPLLATPRVQVHYVSNHVELSIALKQLSESTGPIAIDAERASGFKYSQRAYLIQMKAENSDIFLVDPIAEPEFTSSSAFEALRNLLSSRTWILHAATQDLPCLYELGLKPGGIFDTELAARLAGEPKVGLGSLTESMLGLRLAKEHSAADWSTRPLPESWLRYAALDVDVLHELAAEIFARLTKQGKSEWAAQEFEALESFRPKPPKPDRWRSITGLSKVKDQQSYEIARRLWQSREELASNLDVSPGRLIPDSSILAVATEKPKSKSELASLKTFSGRASRSYLDTWWKAVTAAYKASELPTLRLERTAEFPNHRNWAIKFPAADKRLRFAKSALTELANQINVPLENLLTPDYLRNVSFTPPEDLSEKSITDRLGQLGARRWQQELCSTKIFEAFSLAEQSPDEAVDPNLPEPDEHEAL